MKYQRITRDLFNRPTLTVAKELLGKFLVRRMGNKVVTAMITETEAYVGPRDRASHASRGRTARTEVMFGPPGHAYIYLIYGMYYCFNVVTERKNYPAAVLIRGVRLQGIGSSKNLKLNPEPHTLNASLNGPGKLCRYFKIDKSLNAEDLIISRKLWLEDRGVKIQPNQIKRGKRIGIDYAGVYKHKPWRFYVKV